MPKHNRNFLGGHFCEDEEKELLSQTFIQPPGDVVQGLRKDFRDGSSPDDGERFDLGVEVEPAATSRLWQLQV